MTATTEQLAALLFSWDLYKISRSSDAIPHAPLSLCFQQQQHQQQKSKSVQDSLPWNIFLATESPRAHLHVVGMLRFMSLTETNRACPVLFTMFLCVCVFMAFSTVSYLLFCLGLISAVFGPFNYISLYESLPQPWCGWLWLMGLKASTSSLFPSTTFVRARARAGGCVCVRVRVCVWLCMRACARARVCVCEWVCVVRLMTNV